MQQQSDSEIQLEPLACYPWLLESFGLCYNEPLKVIGLFFGIFSICCWLVAQAPQVITNFQRKDVSSLSPFFLLIWAIGDTSNLLGCIFTNQMLTQRLQAMVFVLIDCCSLCQYIYYRFIYGRRSRRSVQCVAGGNGDLPDDPKEEGDDGDNNDDNRNSTGTSETLDGKDEDGSIYAHSKHSNFIDFKPYDRGQRTKQGLLPLPESGHLLYSLYAFNELVIGVSAMPAAFKAMEDNSSSGNYQLGIIFSWICTGLYLISRIPQILRNWTRKSVDGLCLSMFICVVTANTTYALSVFLQADRIEQIYEAIPFLLGSLGTVSLDFVIFSQFRRYRKRRPSSYCSEEESETLLNATSTTTN